MKRMRKCPVPGCEIMVPPRRFCCKKHWDELPWRERDAWMNRNKGADDEKTMERD